MNPSLLSEKTDIKSYLHLYLGCELDTNIPGDYVHPYGHTKIDTLDSDSIAKVLWTLDKKERDQKGGFIDSDHIYCKPILRPLSSMTVEEEFEIFPKMTSSKWGPYSPDEFARLLSKGFDIFNLIEKGLALSSSNERVEDAGITYRINTDFKTKD